MVLETDYKSPLTTVSVQRETLNAFRQALYRRFGQIRGHVGREADRALRKHIDNLRLGPGGET